MNNIKSNDADQKNNNNGNDDDVDGGGGVYDGGAPLLLLKTAKMKAKEGEERKNTIKIHTLGSRSFRCDTLNSV